jgi:hypothetical protein
MSEPKHIPILDEETDAEMAPGAESTWVGVGDDFSVYIKRTADGVVVDIYARGAEDCDALASCYAFTADAKFVYEEEAKKDEE